MVDQGRSTSNYMPFESFQVHCPPCSPFHECTAVGSIGATPHSEISEGFATPMLRFLPPPHRPLLAATAGFFAIWRIPQFGACGRRAGLPCSPWPRRVGVYPGPVPDASRDPEGSPNRAPFRRRVSAARMARSLPPPPPPPRSDPPVSLPRDSAWGAPPFLRRTRGGPPGEWCWR